MAIAYDAATASGTFINNVGVTFAHTPVGTPRGVKLHIMQRGNSTDSGITPTYGGVNMALVAGGVDTSGEAMRAYTYFLGSSIPTGEQNVVIPTWGSGGASSRAVCITVTAAADTEVVDSEILSGDVADPAMTLVTPASVETFISAVLTSGLDAVTGTAAGDDYSEVHEVDFGTQSGSVIRRTSNGTGGSIGVDWDTGAVSDDVAAVSVAIRETATGTVGSGLIKGILLKRRSMVG